MSGRKINDHSSWVGSKGTNSVFPDGPHKTKTESSAEGVGALGKYEDTTEDIKSQQMTSISKIKGHAQKPGHRY